MGKSKPPLPLTVWKASEADLALNNSKSVFVYKMVAHFQMLSSFWKNRPKYRKYMVLLLDFFPP